MRVLKRTLVGGLDDVRVAAGLDLEQAQELTKRLNSHTVDDPHSYYLVADEEFDLASPSTRALLEVVLGGAHIDERAQA